MLLFSNSIDFVFFELHSSPNTLWSPLGYPCLPLGALWDLNVHRLRCLSTKSGLLEHAAGAVGAAEVVSKTAAQSPPPHAQGPRMTEATQTPSNHALRKVHFCRSALETMALMTAGTSSFHCSVLCIGTPRG